MFEKGLSYLPLSRVSLQDVLLPDGVEHAALLTEVTETLLLIVPIHLQRTTETERSNAACVVMNINL